MDCLPDDGEGAVREVARVYELINTNQRLLLQDHLGTQEPPSTAQLLLGEALRALNIALTVMKQQQQQGSVVTPKSQRLLTSSSPAVADSNGATTMSTSASRGKRRRSYFRCSYKDDTCCMATKYVQQEDNRDPPLFQVTYNNIHTCTTSSPAKENNNLPTGGAASNNNPPINGHHHIMIKPEANVLQPLLSEVSALPLDDLMSCYDPFPIAHQYVAIGDSSCIPGMSCDDLHTESLIADDSEL